MADVTSIKPLGVGIPKGQQRAQDLMDQQSARPVGKPNTVVEVKKIVTHVVQYFDAKGELKRSLIHEVGEQLMTHKSDSAWVEGLRTINPKMEAQVRKLLATAEVSTPIKAEPEVDVLMDDPGEEKSDG
jgi:DNA-directed RNA polymerase subunit F